MRRLLVVSALSLAMASVGLTSVQTSVATVRTTSVRAHDATIDLNGSRVVRLESRPDYVAAYWRGSSRARVSLAFSYDGLHFGTSVPAGRDETGAQRRDGRTYGALLHAAGAVAVRVHGDRPLRLTVLGLQDGASRTQSSRSAGPGAATAATTEPAVVSRVGWSADPQYMTWAPQFYATKKLTVHHTDTSNDYADRAGAEAQIRSIYYYHSVTQGWGDIGYNFLIDKFGTIYEGRYSRDYAGGNPSGDDAAGNGVTGAHTQGWNSGTVGIAMLGTYTSQDVTPAARKALESMLAWEAGRNNIDPQATQPFVNPVSGATITTPNIAGHRDYAATACPGDTFYATLPTIRSDVAALITGSSPAADTAPPSVPAALTATGGKSRVSLSWTASSDNTGVTGYVVQRSRTSSGVYTQVANVSQTSYVDGGLARRTTYYYQVRATDAAGNSSAWSGPASAVTS